MTATVDAVQRFTKRQPCPVCGGHNQLPQGQGVRCYGFLSSDGRYCHCTREEHAHGLPQENGGTYAHRLDGPCKCGQTHGGDPLPSNGHKPESPPRRVIRQREWEVEPGIVHKRKDYDDGTKRVWWETNGIPTLNDRPVESLAFYGIDEVSDAKGIIVVEGEPARDALHPLARELGLAVVGTVTGAGGDKRPSDDVLRTLPAVPLYLWPDSDTPGEAHMTAIADALLALGRPADEIRRMVWPRARAGKGDDAADFVQAGVTVEDLAALDAPEWHGREAPRTETNRDATRPQNGNGREPIGTLAKDVTPERVIWLWAGRLAAGKITIIEGDPGLGKSTATLDLAARISTGMPLPSEREPRSPRGVVVLSAEDGLADTIVPRLIAAGADLGRVFIMTGVRSPDGHDDGVSLPADLDAIERAIVAYDAALVIIDPLMAYLGAETNSNRDQDVRRALAPLAAMLERTGAACALVRHLNKMQGGSALYRGGGSIGISGAARVVLLVAKDPDDELASVMAPQKCNLGPLPPALRFRLAGSTDTDAARVVWDEQPVSINAAGLLAAAGDDEERSALGEAADWLQNYLSLGPRPAVDALKAARHDGHAERTVKRAKVRLGVESSREGFGPGSRVLWFLPDRPSIPDQPAPMSPHGPVCDVGAVWENPHNGAEIDTPIESQTPIGGLETDIGPPWPPMEAGDWANARRVRL
jgi:hypothetical protein